MILGKKLKAIRIQEGLNQIELSQLIDISIDSIRSYETLRRTINEGNLIKITNHERFSKYTLWLMIGQTAPDSGQICPDFSIQERCDIIDAEVVKRA
ncbi:XRE family transcriptional regulator [Psychromonas sp. PRT-SC03]|nr:XRE family transcriptional regulator [Psychromonas sp. PRT-SC03]